MNIKSMIRRGLMDPAMGIGIVEHPLVEEAKRKRDAEALKTSTKTKKTSKKKATKKEA